MKELNEEIKLTLSLMQTDIDDGAHNELQYHLMSLLEIKREQLVTETGLQAELERERERRFEGNRIASAEHREDVKALVEALERIANMDSMSYHSIDSAKITAHAALTSHRKGGKV